MTDHATFLKAILAGDLQAALPYSDWLQGQNDSLDIRRGVLLKRRVRYWLREAEKAQVRHRDRVLSKYWTEKSRRETFARELFRSRQSFVRYIGERFERELVELLIAEADPSRRISSKAI